MADAFFILHPGEDHVRRNCIEYIRELNPQQRWRVEIKMHRAKRSEAQNRLQHALINEIATQRTETGENVRAYCKLHIGVPILRNDDDEYRRKYDRLIRPRPYEEKIEMMKEPWGWPVTSVMTVAQKTQYLDEIIRRFSAEGVEFRFPDELYEEAMR